MSYIVMWLTTVLASYVFDFKIAFKMFKEIADVGYKINADKFRDFANSIPTNSSDISKVIRFIPFVNLLYTLHGINSYENNKQLIFQQFLSLDILEEMTDDEKEEYKKNPTGLNAMVITLNNGRVVNGKIVNEPIATIKEQEANGEFSIVKIKFNSNNKDKFYEIISTSGPISRLSIEEQNEFVEKHLSSAFKKYDSDAKKDTINSTSEEKVEDKKISEESVKPLSRLERYKQLRDEITTNGWLYGEDMWEYRELKEEFENSQEMTLK